jgi:integrase
MTLRELSERYLRDYEETRAARRSERTIDAYRSLWRTHLLPLAGDLRLREITSGVVQDLKTQIAARARTQGGRAKGNGIYAANRALQQLDAALRFAVAREWILRNPAARGIVSRFEETRAEEFLDDAAYAAIGESIRKLEASATRARIRYLAALRLAIYTGARHREEILWAPLSWCRDLDGAVPRIGVPRAKGDRGARQGRWIYLGAHAARLIREMDRPVGSEHLLVPGQRHGSPLHTLIPLWREVLETAGLPRMTVKVLRHSHRTHAVIAGIPEEHEQQLLGHRGAAVTDTVYLHRHGPALAAAAAKIEVHLRGLMGEEVALGTAPAEVRRGGAG